MSTTTQFFADFDITSRSNPQYRPLYLSMEEDVKDLKKAGSVAVLYLADAKEPKLTPWIVLSARDLTLLADALEKMQETARITSSNLLSLSVIIEGQDGNRKQKLSVSYGGNSVHFNMRVINHEADDLPEFQDVEVSLTAGETTAFIASARLFASVLENEAVH